jgi:hypothetical protein
VLLLVRKSDFAEKCNITPGRLSQWLKEGKFDRDCVIGEGQRAPIDARRALQQLVPRLACSTVQAVALAAATRPRPVT